MDERIGCNPWGIKFGSMFHMSNDSHLFKTYQQLLEVGAVYVKGHFEVEGILTSPCTKEKCSGIITITIENGR